MLRRIIALVICLAMASATTLVFAEDVYFTERGKKYHKQDCPFIANSETQKASLGEATEKGLLPCGRCFKSADKQEITSAVAKNKDLVYTTANGKKYHQADCRLIKNKEVTGVSLKEAQAKGLEPCGRCFPQPKEE